MHHIPYIATDVIQTDSGAFLAVSDTVRTVLHSTTTAQTSLHPTTTYIGSEYIEIAGKRFSSKQLAYLLSKLLDEHPECQV